MPGHTQIRHARRATPTTLITFVLLTAACSQGNGRKYTWADRLPTSDCQPRTSQAKNALGGCPKMTDPEHPTPDEVREFVNYMNAKQRIEGTVVPQGLEGPGCLQWRVDPSTGQPERYGTGRKQGCISFEDAIKNSNLP
jgi:hypothetical protein